MENACHFMNMFMFHFRVESFIAQNIMSWGSEMLRYCLADDESATIQKQRFRVMILFYIQFKNAVRFMNKNKDIQGIVDSSKQTQ